jgi:hypothetical protein
MIRMLIGAVRWRQEEIGSDFSDQPGNCQVVSRGDIHPAIAAKIEELDRRPEQLCRLARFRFAFLRRTVCPALASRTNTKADRAPARRFREEHAATAKLEVVGMRAEGEKREVRFRNL